MNITYFNKTIVLCLISLFWSITANVETPNPLNQAITEQKIEVKEYIYMSQKTTLEQKPYQEIYSIDE